MTSNNKTISVWLVLLCGAVGLWSCTSEGTAPTTTAAHSPIVVDAALGLGSGASYEWSVVDAPSELYSLTGADQEKPLFLAAQSGSYRLRVVARLGDQSTTQEVAVAVEEPKQAHSPYIAQVFDYAPSAGQFVNELPAYQSGYTRTDMIAQAAGYLVGKKNGGLVCLGGFGGSITFGFDHTVVNVKGRRDFRIMGNAFYSDVYLDGPKGGSCEPGIVRVSYDANRNGLADDAWYEIAGSEYHKPTTIKNYSLTYSRPATETPTDPARYLPWQDNQGGSGYLAKNEFHQQPYYPLWQTESERTFSGTLLPNNSMNLGTTEQYWVLYAYGYGYADNALNTEADSAIDIDWAVDANGHRVVLPGIDFVEVYTGLHQQCGWLGESSTEVAGAYDLHLLGEVVATF